MERHNHLWGFLKNLAFALPIYQLSNIRKMVTYTTPTHRQAKKPLKLFV